MAPGSLPPFVPAPYPYSQPPIQRSSPGSLEMSQMSSNYIIGNQLIPIAQQMGSYMAAPSYMASSYCHPSMPSPPSPPSSYSSIDSFYDANYFANDQSSSSASASDLGDFAFVSDLSTLKVSQLLPNISYLQIHSRNRILWYGFPATTMKPKHHCEKLLRSDQESVHYQIFQKAAL